MKNKNLISSLIFSLIALTLGILLITLDGSVLSNIIFIIIGVVMILTNLTQFIDTCKNLKYKTSVAIGQFITSFSIMALAVLIIIFRDQMSLYIGIIILVIALIDIIMSKKDLIEGIRHNLASIIFAIILLIFGFGGILKVACIIIGVILIVLSFFSLINAFSKK